MSKLAYYVNEHKNQVVFGVQGLFYEFTLASCKQCKEFYLSRTADDFSHGTYFGSHIKPTGLAKLTQPQFAGMLCS